MTRTRLILLAAAVAWASSRRPVFAACDEGAWGSVQNCQNDATGVVETPILDDPAVTTGKGGAVPDKIFAGAATVVGGGGSMGTTLGDAVSGGGTPPRVERRTVYNQKCEERMAGLGRSCVDEYNKELAALQNAQSKKEVDAIQKRIDAVSGVIEEIQDKLGPGYKPPAGSPLAAIGDVLRLSTDKADEAVEAAYTRVERSEPKQKGGPVTVEDPTALPTGEKPGAKETPAAALENQVEELLKNGDYEGALGLMDGPGNQGQQSPRLRAMRAMALLNAGDPDGALKAAEQALKLDPANDEARQVKLYIESGGQVKDTRLKVKRPDFGTQGLGSAFGGGSGDSLAMGRGPGRAVGEAGDGPGAPGAVPGSQGGWAALGPGSGRDWGAMGGRPGGAATGTSSAQPLTPSQALVMSSLNKARVGDVSGALLDSTRAIQADKANARAWTVRAGISNRLKNHDAAISDATEALKLEPKSVPALLERGFAQYGLANYSSALSDIGEALKLEPLNALAYLYRGMVFEKMARVTEALSDYE
ncbi:MAG: tetratricopeptide repeat protein, partial [Elusimicrobia bacterium]|nr:tetratricopeptide repeat protein [Elusimicrobiota bacterium]